MESRKTDFSNLNIPPRKGTVVHDTAHYHVVIIELELGHTTAAYAPLARKYAVIHKGHEVVGMVTEILPNAIGAAEALNAALENALLGNLSEPVQLPGKIN